MPDPSPAETITAYLDTLAPAVSPFVLRRHHDVTGVSGTGIVADGVLFPAAGGSKAVVRWRGERGSTVVWDSLRHVREIHGHDGATVVELIPVDELIKALRAVAAHPLAIAQSDDPEHVAAVGGYNDCRADLHDAIVDAIETLHGHGDES